MVKELSAIITISERYDDIEPLYRLYREGLAQTGLNFEMIYVLDGDFPEAQAALEQLRQSDEQLRVIVLGKWFGEAVALNVALSRAEGNTILTLPAYVQVEPSAIPQLVDCLAEADVAVAVRSPRRDSVWNRLASRFFHGILKFMAGGDFADLGCGLRAYRRRVFDEVAVYGDLHRFLPLLAARAGFTVTEVEAPQAAADMGRRIYRPGVYLRRLLDILTVFFLVKFTKKPLRFFGLLGASSAGIGAVALGWLLIDRIFFSIPLGDRPALLLSVLLFSVGVQLIAVGLIGELIIFTHGLDSKEYTIDRIVEARDIDADEDSRLSESKQQIG